MEACTRKMDLQQCQSIDLLFWASVFASSASSTWNVLRAPDLTRIIPRSPVQIALPPWAFLSAPQTSLSFFGTPFVLRCTGERASLMLLLGLRTPEFFAKL